MKKLRDHVSNNIVCIAISLVFILVYAANELVGGDVVYDALSGSGFGKLDGELYRLLTASFLHGSIVHLFSNIAALLCVGSFLEKRLGRLKMLLLYLGVDIAASLLFYGYMNECTGGNGSSIAIFGLFAVLLALWLRYPNELKFKRFSPALIYIIIYFFAANMVSGSYTTIIIHAFSFVVGLAAGIIMVTLRAQKKTAN